MNTIMMIVLKIIEYAKKLFGKKANSGIDKWVDKTKPTTGKDESKRYIEEGKKFDLLGVDFDSQRDNKIDPGRTCYPTSVKMVLHTLETALYGGQQRARVLRDDWEDWVIKYLQDNRKRFQKITFGLVKADWVMSTFPRYVGAFWVWFINNEVSGMKATYKYFTRQQLKDFIREHKVPVVTSTKLTGDGGHIIVTKGFDDKGFICNDPWGDAHDYRNRKSPKYGESVYYEDAMMKKSIGCVVITHDET